MLSGAPRIAGRTRASRPWAGIRPGRSEDLHLAPTRKRVVTFLSGYLKGQRHVFSIRNSVSKIRKVNRMDFHDPAWFREIAA